MEDRTLSTRLPILDPRLAKPAPRLTETVGLTAVNCSIRDSLLGCDLVLLFKRIEYTTDCCFCRLGLCTITSACT